MNVLIISGNITRDVEMAKTKEGVSIAKGSLAVNKGKDKADFVSFAAFNANADYLGQYGSKGARAEIVGRLESRKYTDKEGNERTVWECIVDKVHVFSKSDKPREEKPATPEDAYYSAPVEDDLPF